MIGQPRQLKGGTFLNRYLIKATLKAITPFHIGDGTKLTKEWIVDDEGNKLKITAVTVDEDFKAYIPGSSLRGALRDWLRLNNNGMTENLEMLSARNEIKEIRDDNNKSDQEKDDEIFQFIKDNSTALERIFGTQHNEGKLEVWDAYCTSGVKTPTDNNGQMCYWNKERLTYVAKSVAINPETGTAEEGKLYNYELVPPGATFEVTFSAQNLTENEPALIMAVLNGFNHLNNPITIGAMTKLDFGRFCIKGFKIYRLDSTNLDKWKEIAKTVTDTRAGYDLIADNKFKLEGKELDDLINATLPAPKPVQKYVENWTLNLETPLVVRSGSKAGWKNTPGVKKARNYMMEFKWDVTITDLNNNFDQVGDLYHSLEIIDDKVVPYYHIPSSSVRGPLRAWAIEHLLPKDWWNIEDKFKGSDFPNNKPAFLDNILCLFGFAIEGARKEISEKYTKAGRLTIRVDRFRSDQAAPAVDGADWNTDASNVFGPSNAERHIKPRNPLDRITNAAKEKGLHNFLEFSKRQNLTLTIEILKPSINDEPDQEAFDLELLKRWKLEINSGGIRFGGLTGIGRGRVLVIASTGTKKEVTNG